MGYEALANAVIKGNIDQAKEQTQKAINDGVDAQNILDEGLIAAMDVVGDKFAKGAMFVPQMLRSAKTMQECVTVLKPHFQGGGMTAKGKVILGTVKGDLHDIGKNLVAMMLEGAGFDIIDLGTDVSPAQFVEAIQEHRADLVGMSALLTTTMPSMRLTIDAIQKAGLRDAIKIMVGGAPVTQRFSDDIGADVYAPDAPSAVREAKEALNA